MIRMASVRGGIAAMLIVLLAGCGDDPGQQLPSEQVAAAPLLLQVEAVGTLKAVKAQPLLVPGAMWQPRQLVWMKPDGSRVEAGEVVARFSASRNQLELDKALLDLRRNQLARLGKQDELAAAQGRVGVDLAQVATDMAIADRYATADFTMLARNQILDAVQDREFLGVKQGVLEWQQDQSSARGGAELAVLDAQKSTYALNAETRRQDLDALELRAPNAGVLVLSTNWSGEKARIGASMWAGNDFATLPDASALEVELSLPQLAAQGVAVGQAVELYPAGRPEQAVRSTLSWVASAAQQRGRNNPVKTVSMKVPVPADAATEHGWVPGQAFHARIILLDDAAAISVPNIALQSEGERNTLQVAAGDGWIEREVEVGARGPARTQVTAGLQAGERVLLLPAAAVAQTDGAATDGGNAAASATGSAR